MSGFEPPAGYLSVAQVAALRQTDHSAAWKFLQRNAGKHFRRIGGRRVISKERYRQLVMETYVQDELAKVKEDFAAHCEENDEEFRRLEALIRSLGATRSR